VQSREEGVAHAPMTHTRRGNLPLLLGTHQQANKEVGTVVMVVMFHGILLWCVLESDLILLQNRLVKNTAFGEKGIFLGRGEIGLEELET